MTLVGSGRRRSVARRDSGSGGSGGSHPSTPSATPGRAKARLAVAVTFVIMVAVEFVALRADTVIAVVVIAGVGGLAVIFAIAGGDLVKIGLGATFLSAFTLTWNGWFVGPVRPGDVLPLVALICFGLSAKVVVFRAPPWWVRQVIVGLMFLLVLLVLFPTSPHYLDARNLVGAGGQNVDRNNNDLAFTNVAITAKFIIAVAIIPIIFATAARIDRRVVRWLAILFATGSALSGAVAFVDHTGLASIGQILTHLPPESTRTIGFSNHPNFLASALCLSAPFCCWMMTSRIKWEQRVGAIALISSLLGIYGSGSRGGTVCIIGAVGLAFILLPRTRAHIPSIVAAGIAAVGVLIVIFPDVGLSILRVTRLYGNATTAGSDAVRDLAAAQGWRDFDYSPFKGIGLQASTDASQVYIQQLAAGGIVLFITMSVYMAGAIWSSFRVINRTPIAAAACAACIATLAVNLFEASLTDRFYYLPEALLVAVLAMLRPVADPAFEGQPYDEFDPDYVPPPGDEDFSVYPAADGKETGVTRR